MELLPSLSYIDEQRFWVVDQRRPDKARANGEVLVPPYDSFLPYLTEREMIKEFKALDFEKLKQLLAEATAGKAKAKAKADSNQELMVHHQSEIGLLTKAIQEQQWPAVFPCA